MSVERQVNWLGQMRVDVPNMRALESSISHDFDVNLGKIVSGETSVVVKGLTINISTAAGNPASSLVLTTAGALVMHFDATEAGTMLEIPDTQAADALNTSNSKVQGGFAASSSNYIGIDFLRSADTTTDDQVEFLAANTGAEVPRTVPTARTLSYVIIISQTPFSLSTNVCPVAIVTTDASNNVSAVTDCRNLFGRLATGGDVPNTGFSFPWVSRAENPAYAPPTTTTDPFSGGDKSIASLKDWMNATMSMLWEAKSGQYWYSQTTRDGLKVGMSGAAVFAVNNDNFLWVWSGASGTLKWQGLSVLFENSTQYYNPIADNSSVGVTITAGQCLYVDVNRVAANAIVNGGFLTRVSTTVTATTNSPHGFSNGVVYLTITDTNFPAGAKTITVTGASTFTYTETGSAVSSTNPGSFEVGLSAQVGTLESLSGPTVPGSRFILCWVGVDGQLYIRDRPFDYGRLTNVLVNAAGYPTYYVKNDFQLQQAVAGTAALGGGVIAFIASFSITQSYSINANVKFLGELANSVITVPAGFGFTFSDNCKLEDMWFDHTTPTSGTTITGSGVYFSVENSVFKENAAGTGVAISITGNYGTVNDSRFYGCIVPSTATGVSVGINSIDTFLNNNTFLN